MLALLRPFLGPLGLVLWLAVVGWGLKGAADHWDALFREGEGVLSPDNWLWLYLTGFVVKLWHETGHGLLCRRFGGEVRSAGVMLLVLTPLPYVDVTSSWAFRSHLRRMLVAAGGMLFELFLAAIAMQVWSVTGAGVVHAVAFNIMVLASVTTLLFNINPLLRFDGYYIFCDLLQLPNLAQRSQARLRFVLERYIFGSRHATAPEVTRPEGAWLLIYGLVSSVYRIFLMGVIVLMVAEHFLGLGLLLAAFSFVVWVIVPILKFVRYVLRDPGLERVRGRARRVTFATIGALVLFAGFVPLPRHFRAPGVVDAEQEHDVKANVSGYVAEVLVTSGTMLKKGQPILRLDDPENIPRLEAARLQLRQIEARRQFANVQAMATLRAIEADDKAVRALLVTLEQQRADLIVKAPGDGLWVCPMAAELPGVWANRGTTFGKVIDAGSFRFTAAVSQDDSSNLFGGQIKSAEVRINGEDGRMLPLGKLQIIPSKQDFLPAVALGWKGGGPIRVLEDEQGLHAAEPFFQVYGAFTDRGGVRLMQHRTGQMRITLEPEPLIVQGARQLRQLFQQRLQL
jgi:putative peptide zinc metalloprotease protein